MLLSRPGWSNSLAVTTTIATTRCDNAIGARRSGCVLHQFPAIWGISASAHRDFAFHVSRALESGLPGTYTSTKYARRLTAKSLRDKNGTKARPSSLDGPQGFPATNTHAAAPVRVRTQARQRQPAAFLAAR
jgi:hypothetical protein